MLSTPRVIIIGGGASGTLLACHLLREPLPDLRITLIEQRGEPGPGVAFSAPSSSHLLNVAAANMGAFADEPQHFWHWLVRTGTLKDTGDAEPFFFAPRATYGRYLRSLIEPHLAGPDRAGRLSIVQGTCIDVAERPSGVEVRLDDGTSVPGHVAVLATGHEEPRQDGCHVSPWVSPSVSGIDPDATVLILGTGLTMVDYVLSLLDARHRGPIVAMSRRGLLPQAHRRVAPMTIDAADIPFGTDISYFMHWLRETIAWAEGRGEDWRSVIDGLRPHTQRIWQSFSQGSQRRFIAHARAWWDVHRHRMPPEVDTRLRAALATGRVHLLAGKVIATEERGNGARVHYRRRGNRCEEMLDVDAIVSCTGIVTNPGETKNPLLHSLFASGRARVDPLAIGLDVTTDGALIDDDGRPSARLFAVGPVTRAAFWEIVAVPDIRTQCSRLARRILHDAATHTAASRPP